MIPSKSPRFQDRLDAARQLAEKLKERSWNDPLILGIPRGGLVIGAVLAEELGGELDVVLARKLRAPHQPELAIGSLGEDGKVIVNPQAQEYLRISDEYLKREIKTQFEEIQRRRALVRNIRDQAPVAGRSVIVTDDGIATGSTMIAGLQVVRDQQPKELIVAVPVASPDRLDEVRRWCDEAICLLCPEDFYAIGQFYDDFTQVEDEEALALLTKTKR